jgi:DNA invertase Pin-like site-specific DNA recombinase
MKSPKAALYARVSTREKGQDPEMQLHHLRNYAKSRGFEIYKEYVDHGISGAKEARANLDDMMDAARKKRFDIVVVFRYSRFARSLTHAIKALDEFKHLGIDFISFNESIDTSSPYGKVIYALIAALAEVERDQISENVKAGLERARAKGKILGRPKAQVTIEQIEAARTRRISLRQMAVELRVSKATICRILAEAREVSKTSAKMSLVDVGSMRVSEGS